MHASALRYFGSVIREAGKRTAFCLGCYYNQTTGFRSFFISFDDGARLEIMNKPSMEDIAKPVNRTGYIHIAFSVSSIQIGGPA